MAGGEALQAAAHTKKMHVGMTIKRVRRAMAAIAVIGKSAEISRLPLPALFTDFPAWLEPS
ncbi:hypothetical protein [Paraburkholderia bannensis]|uniref:hypothetical protein n=1 Tax=Paraburkholderia bannensis TaxID=765414 RepID=UPI002ABD4F4C|nr:hypothetical protein [Paraburkholderia bannensis]